MTVDISSVYNSSDSSTIENLIESYIALEERPKIELEDKKESLYEKKQVLTTLHSKLSALKTKSDDLANPLTDNFAAKKAISSDSEKFTVSATSSAETGNHTLTVDRMAIADTRVSQQYTDSNTSFSGFTTDQTFSIEVAHPTDIDPNNRVLIDVTITADVFTQTDDEVIIAISEAIDDAMSSAVLTDTIGNNEGVQASIVTEQTGVSRMVLRSKLSGYDYRVEFTDSADSLLAAMELNLAALSSGTSGGYMTEVGTSATDSLLNSKFTMDGLTFYRNENSISDALNGVTIKLLDTFTTSENITVQVDVEDVKDEVREFIDVYNALLETVRDSTVINTETGTAGLLANDSRYMDMRNELRTIMMQAVSGVSNADYSSLFNIGIQTNDIGMLSIADASLFNEALEANTTNVSDLFLTESTGLVDKLIEYVDKFVGSEGKILNSKNSIDEQVSYLDDRIDQWEDYLYEKEKQLREEFTSLQEMMSLLQAQSTTLLQYT